MSSRLADALFWIAVASCALAQVALLHSFFLGASRPRRTTALAFRATETLWAIVPALVLVALLAATRQAMQAPLAAHAATPAVSASAAPAPVAASGVAAPTRPAGARP